MPCGKTITQRVFPAIQALEKAASAFEKAIQLAPDDIYVHTVLAGKYSMMGREKEDRAEAKEILRINPKVSVDSLNISIDDRSVLRKAGLK